MTTTISKTVKAMAILFIACGLIFSACKKGDTGAAGPSAKKYDFTLTFGTSTTLQTYNMPSMSLYEKVAFVYLDKGYKDWVLLPYYENSPGHVPVNYVATIDEILEKIEIRTDRGDNQPGSPWASDNVQKNFRVVVIEASSARPANNNYEEVKAAYNLKD